MTLTDTLVPTDADVPAPAPALAPTLERVDAPPGTALDGVDLVVLDAHGVVFSREFPAFLRRRALQRGDDPTEIWARWQRVHRHRFWLGLETPAELWAGLFPGDCPARLSAELERSYRPGPLYRQVATGDQRLWLLSNHRSGWLLPRLERFGLVDRFERVLVSDQLGAAKPDPAAFAAVRDAMAVSSVRVLDDSPVNVAAARRLGIPAELPPLATVPPTARRTT